MRLAADDTCFSTAFPFSDMTPACGPSPLQYLPFEGTGVSFGLNIEVFYEGWIEELLIARQRYSVATSR
jgi:hypothetical protein